MVKKRTLLIIVAILMMSVVWVGITQGLLLSRSRSIINTFVSGNIEIELTESTGVQYTLVPGCALEKDPRITVKEGSEECWLFFKVEYRDELDTFITYSMSDGWTALSGVENVYWRRVNKCVAGDRVYSVLKNNEVLVKDTVTEEKLAAINHDLGITFSAYAIQYETISTPEKAWEIIKSEEDEA